MLPAQRQQVILDELSRSGAVRVSDLTALLRVSDMTVRRDLDTLERQGLLEKVHGGATAPRTGGVEEPAFETKRGLEQREKQAIAALAATLVRPGHAVGLSAGSTTYALANVLRDVPGITVVTNAPPLAEVLWRSGRPDQTIVLTGGVRTPSDALVGPVAVGSLRGLNLDIVFMGVHGIDARAGFTTPNLLEAETDRALVAAGRRLVVVADHTKWGVVGISTIAALSDAHALVTDDGLDEQARRLLEDEVGNLLLASTAGPQDASSEAS